MKNLTVYKRQWLTLKNLYSQTMLKCTKNILKLQLTNSFEGK